jgi:hypothetical protein
MIKGSGAEALEPLNYCLALYRGQDLNLRPLGYELPNVLPLHWASNKNTLTG